MYRLGVGNGNTFQQRSVRNVLRSGSLGTGRFSNQIFGQNGKPVRGRAEPYKQLLMRLNYLFIHLLILFSCCSANAQSTDTLLLSLQEAVRLALENNPDLQQDQLNVKIRERQLQTLKATGLPQIAVSARFTDNFSIAESLLPGEIFGQTGQVPVRFGTRFLFNTGVQVHQIVLDKERKIKVKKLNMVRQADELQVRAGKEELIYQIAQVYIQCQITIQQKQIQAGNLKRNEQLLAIAQVQFDNGVIKKVDLDQLTVMRNNLTTSLANMELIIDEQIRLLKWYLALDPETPVNLAHFSQASNAYPLANELNLSENIDYQLLKKEKELVAMDRDMISAAYDPVVSAFFQYTFTGQGDRLNFSRDNFFTFHGGLWGLQLSVPIFDGFQKKHRLQENKLEFSQLGLQDQHLRRGKALEFESARAKVIENNRLFGAQLENMELSNTVYEITKLAYQEGVESLSELLHSENNLRQAQVHYLNALLEYRLAELNLAKVSGRLIAFIDARTD